MITCTRFYATTLLKEFRVIGTPPSRTHKLISDYNKNILINSRINEIKHSLRPIPEILGANSNILDTRNA